VEVSVEGMNLTRNIYLARNRRQSLTRAQAKFWEFVTSKFKTADKLKSDR